MDRITATGLAKIFELKPGQFATVDGRREGCVTVLDGFDVAVRRGEFLTLVGPSGSGKSVFLDIVAGLTAATGGEARIDGKAIRTPDPRMAYVFQQYALFPWRTALENVEYALEVRGATKADRRARARHFLSLFGLGDFEDRYPSQLSGGMQQRVAIARALSTEPEVLLMDEPFAALDAQTRDVLQTELLRIWERTDATVIFVTHAIDEAVYLADRIVAMTARPGRVKEVIDVPLARPRDPEVRGTPAFAALRAQVWEVLRDEVTRAQKDWGLAAPTH